MRFFPQSRELDEAGIRRGMNLLMADTIAFQAMFALTSGVILMDFARTLVPKNDALIGLLAAIPPLCQLCQAPAIPLVERLRNRRAITVVAATAGRLAWFLYPLIPFVENRALAAALLVGTQVWYYALTNVAGCAISSWIRDLVPESRISGYFGRRLAISTGAAALTLGGVCLLLPRGDLAPETRLGVLAACFAAGGAAGMISSTFIGLAPEPEPPSRPPTPVRALLAEPLRDAAFRRFLTFNAAWFFVYGMSWQFFPKHLLARHGLELGVVTALTMGGLLLNALFFRIWAGVAERHGDPATLSGALPLYLGGLLLWPLAEILPRTAGMPLAVGAFLLCGAAFAGMQLGTTNIALKLAPRGKATAYIAMNALVAGFAASISPVAGGVLADALDAKGRFQGLHTLTLPVSGLAAVFMLATLLGVFALRRMARIPGPVAPPRRDIYTKALAETSSATLALGGRIGAVRLSALGLLFGKSPQSGGTSPRK